MACSHHVVASFKAQRERDRLNGLREKRAALGDTGRAAREAEREIEKQELVVADVEEFCAALRRAAELRLTPDLNRTEQTTRLTIGPDGSSRAERIASALSRARNSTIR